MTFLLFFFSIIFWTCRGKTLSVLVSPNTKENWGKRQVFCMETTKRNRGKKLMDWYVCLANLPPWKLSRCRWGGKEKGLAVHFDIFSWYLINFCSPTIWKLAPWLFLFKDKGFNEMTRIFCRPLLIPHFSHSWNLWNCTEEKESFVGDFFAAVLACRFEILN